jgi:hypothetical protein
LTKNLNIVVSKVIFFLGLLVFLLPLGTSNMNISNANAINNKNLILEKQFLPSTVSLTVTNQVVGCDNIVDVPGILEMSCMLLLNNTSDWLGCNNSNISNLKFCQSIPEDIFDIEVFEDQNNQIQEFEGSEQGTTIQNLEPGTYTVNEIKNSTSSYNQIMESEMVESQCLNAGFAGGGILVILNTTESLEYSICFEYEGEQGNDCSTITLAAEERTCIVKNYINFAYAFAD